MFIVTIIGVLLVICLLNVIMIIYQTFIGKNYKSIVYFSLSFIAAAMTSFFVAANNLSIISFYIGGLL